MTAIERLEAAKCQLDSVMLTTNESIEELCLVLDLLYAFDEALDAVVNEELDELRANRLP